MSTLDVQRPDLFAPATGSPLLGSSYAKRGNGNGAGGGSGGTKPLRVLVACEFSATIRREFAAHGHDAWSCDILPSEHPCKHLQCDVRDVLSDGWDLMIAHPPCTYLCRAGWHWVNKPDSTVPPLKGEPRRQAAREAADFFRLLLSAPIAMIAIENPRPVVHVNLPPHSQVIQPWQFGHGEVKATCLWLKGLPNLTPTNIVDGREARVHRMPPGPNRWRERSRTFPGIAHAMASQWSAWAAGVGSGLGDAPTTTEATENGAGSADRGLTHERRTKSPE